MKTDLKNIDTRYKPLPFWSWNDELNTQETSRQTDIMGESGCGGFFMHARGGLLTEYMSEDWFENVRAAIDAAKKYDMEVWAYACAIIETSGENLVKTKVSALVSI